MIDHKNHLSRERNAFRQIASVDTLFNKAEGVSFSSCKYTEVVKVSVGRLGKVYLAPQEKTVILPDEAKATAKRLRLSSVDILNACNKFKAKGLSSAIMVERKCDRNM